jgi:LacI family transcriptional regulator
VSQKTRDKVRRIARELNYHPNLVARSLSTGKRLCIGIADTARLDELDNLTMASYHAGIGKVTEDKDYHMMFFSIKQDEWLQRIVRAAQSKMVDGIITKVYSTHYKNYNTEVAPRLLESGVPFVALHAVSRGLHCNNIGFDAVKAGHLGTTHLIGQGIKDIGMVGLKGRIYNDELFTGYCRAMKEHGLDPVDLRLDIADYRDKADDGYELGKELIKKDGVREGYFIFSDFFSYGFIDALKETGKQVPQDVLVTGCGNVVSSSIFRSTLTTVDIKLRERGQRAAELLFSLMEPDNNGNEYTTYIQEPELVVRGSSIR